MYIKPLMSSAIVFLIIFNHLIETKEFCQAFRDNDNSISYVFQWNFDDIIIDGHYWRLNYSLGLNYYSSTEFTDSTDSKPCPLFTGNYSMAILLIESGQFGAYLFDKNDWRRVVMAGIPDRDNWGTAQNLSDFKEVARGTLQGDNLPNYPIAVYRLLTNMVVINGSVSGKIHPYYEMDNFKLIETTSKYLLENGSKNFTIFQPFFNFKSPHKLIGVFQRFYDSSIFVVLLQNKQKILWCYLDVGKESPHESCIKDPNVLIDCSEGMDIKVNIIIIFTAIVVVIVIIAIICIVIYFYVKKCREGMDTTSSVLSTASHSSNVSSQSSVSNTKGFSEIFSVGKPSALKI